MQNFTGVNAYISQMGFLTSAFNDDFGNYVPFLMGLTQVFAALYSVSYLYRFNKKKLILVGNFAMGVCCLGIGVCYFYI
jgi:hypothetical protein